MSNNLAAVAAQLRAGLGVALQAAANGELERVIADAHAERGLELVAEGFESKQGPNGAPWAPAAHDYGHPLLDATGELKSSAQTLVSRCDASGHEITLFVTDEKAPWHQHGTKRNGKQHIPARPFLPEGPWAREVRPWLRELNIVGQATIDRWLESNVRV